MMGLRSWDEVGSLWMFCIHGSMVGWIYSTIYLDILSRLYDPLHLDRGYTDCRLHTYMIHDMQQGCHRCRLLLSLYNPDSHERIPFGICTPGRVNLYTLHHPELPVKDRNRPIPVFREKKLHCRST